jgi:large subunit ribosomal protein L36e
MAKGLAVGLNKGYVVSKIEVPSWVQKKQPRKRVSVVRKVISEIVGKSAFEKKIIEVLKQTKQTNSQKKAYKLAKKALGTHKRAIKKRTELQEFIAKHH